MLKRCTRFLALAATGCLIAVAVCGQSYTVRFIEGTAHIDKTSPYTRSSLDELKYRLSDCHGQIGTITLTAMQNVTERYDPDARALALDQAVALQEYLTEVCSLHPGTSFDIEVDAQTDLDNRVIVEVSRTLKMATNGTNHLASIVRQETEPASLETATAVQTESPNNGTKTAATVQPKTTKSKAANFWLGGVGFGIKTNGLLFAGLLPDGSMYTLVPNGSVEVYFANHFSGQLTFAYALPYKKGDKTNLFKMTGFLIEPRFWLRNDGSFRGLYAGVYGQYGTFDVRIKEEFSNNSTGTFYGGGVSAGWLQPIWKGFFAEAGLQVGYRSDATDVYTYTKGKPYKRVGSYTLNSFTLQGFNVSIGYRF